MNSSEEEEPGLTQRDVIAQAFGWTDWHEVEMASRRDGYTEAGGRGALARSIALAAASANALIEYVERYGPYRDAEAHVDDAIGAAYRAGYASGIDAALGVVASLPRVTP